MQVLSACNRACVICIPSEQVFANRSFITKMFTAGSDINDLAQTDADLTKVVGDMQLSLQV